MATNAWDEALAFDVRESATHSHVLVDLASSIIGTISLDLGAKALIRDSSSVDTVDIGSRSEAEVLRVDDTSSVGNVVKVKVKKK